MLAVCGRDLLLETKVRSGNTGSQIEGVRAIKRVNRRNSVESLGSGEVFVLKQLLPCLEMDPNTGLLLVDTPLFCSARGKWHDLEITAK